MSQSSKRYKLACFATIDDSSQPAHPLCLIRVFDGRYVSGKWSTISSGGKLSVFLSYYLVICFYCFVFMIKSIAVLVQILYIYVLYLMLSMSLGSEENESSKFIYATCLFSWCHCSFDSNIIYIFSIPQVYQCIWTEGKLNVLYS